MSDMVHKLKCLGIFSSMSDSTLKELASHFEIVRVKNREVVIHENSPIEFLYMVLYGSVKIQKMGGSGTPVILNFLGRGEFLGISMIDLVAPLYPVSVVAMEDAALLKVSNPFFKETLLKIPEIRAVVSRQICERFQELQNDRCMATSRMPQRLADLIIRILEKQPSMTKAHITMPITRKDLALRLGTHTETIIRILSDWTRRGYIQTINKQIVISDLAGLQGVRNEKTLDSIAGATSKNFEHA